MFGQENPCQLYWPQMITVIHSGSVIKSLRTYINAILILRSHFLTSIVIVSSNSVLAWLIFLEAFPVIVNYMFLNKLHH